MARGLLAALPAAQLQAWLLQDTSEKERAAQAGRQVLDIIVKRQLPGSDIWEKFSDGDAAFKWQEAVRTAALTLPGEQRDLTDTDGTKYRVMSL